MVQICNDKQFKQIAFQYYDNPQCFSYREFELDLRMFNQLSVLLNRFANKDKNVSLRMILNRIIIIHNIFGKFTCYGLFYKVPSNHWTFLKTLLVFLSFIPEECPQFTIDDDEVILQQLNQI